MPEKRRHKRVRVSNSSVICRGREDEKIYLSMVFDLSEGGMGFITRADINIGTELRFDFQIPEEGVNVSAGRRDSSKVYGTGSVVWAVPLKDVFGEPLTRCGVQFKSLPPTSIKSVKSYVKKSAEKKA